VADKSYFTTTEVAAHFGVADWQARRAVDALNADVPRAGLYRLVPACLLERVRLELLRRGWLRETAEVPNG
jgi:hypothetical protein